MVELDKVFEIVISKDKMEAIIKQTVPYESKIVVDDLKKYIHEHGIIHGIMEETVKDIIEGSIELPAVIAIGTPPTLGQDAYLKPVLPSKQEQLKTDKEKEWFIDLREVINIPSVETGDVVGIKVERVEGEKGVDVFGQEIAVKQSRDFKLRPGKNTRVSEDGLQIISLIDGQVSIEPKVIHVYPIYEVNGDLDMKIGNIDFVGNVNIRGNVPSGYKVIAKGDIRVHGTVESAELISGGSIFIHQGIVAQGRGLIRAKGDVHTAFINQGNVEADGDVTVDKGILHSNINALGYIYCNTGRGNIVGGSTSSGKGMEVNEVGNSMSTPTALYLGISQQTIESERQNKVELDRLQSDLEKLTVLLKNIQQKETHGELTTKEKIMKLRIKKTLEETSLAVEKIREDLIDLHEYLQEHQNTAIKINNAIFPNTDIHFGKYRRKIVSKHQHISFRLDHSEIKMEHL